MAMIAACSWAVISAKTITGNLNVVPQPYSVTQDLEAAPFVINKSTIIAYPEGNAVMQRNAEFLASYIAKSCAENKSQTSHSACRGCRHRK